MNLNLSYGFVSRMGTASRSMSDLSDLQTPMESGPLSVISVGRAKGTKIEYMLAVSKTPSSQRYELAFAYE